MTIHSDLSATVGHTPLLRLRHASALTGCEILAKAEFLNPGGSIKDRTALGLLRDAEQRGLIRTGGIIVEGTAGNTGIGLALLGASRGYRTVIFMPETQSREKIDALRIAGAEVRLVPAVPYKDPNHYAHQARAHAEALNDADAGGAWFANQFDNTANRDWHEATTGVEIWQETGGHVDGAPIDLAWSIPDDESVPLLHRLLHEEGWCTGGSSGVNLAGAIRLARMLGPGHTIVTVLADAGTRYQAKLFNPAFLRGKGIPVPDWLEKAFQG
jgi:cysteine synthase